MLDFKPPKPNLKAIKVANVIVPLANRLFSKGLSIDIDAESIDRIKSIHGNPTLIAPNHAASR